MIFKPKRRKKNSKLDRFKKITKEQKERYEKYLKTKEWKALREQALEFHGRNCGKCGSIFKLEVHHKTYDNLYCETMADLMILCSPCHKQHHRQEKEARIKRNGRVSRYMRNPSYEIAPTTYYPNRAKE